MKDLEELVYLTIGRASMRWSEIPRGVFDDQEASRLGKALMEAIEKHSTTIARLSHTTIVRDNEGGEMAKKTKYVMTGKMKDGSTAPSGGVVKTKNGHAVKRTK